MCIHTGYSVNQHPFLQLPDSEAQKHSSGTAKGIAEGIALPSVSKETPVLDSFSRQKAKQNNLQVRIDSLQRAKSDSKLERKKKIKARRKLVDMVEKEDSSLSSTDVLELLLPEHFFINRKSKLYKQLFQIAYRKVRHKLRLFKYLRIVASSRNNPNLKQWLKSVIDNFYSIVCRLGLSRTSSVVLMIALIVKAAKQLESGKPNQPIKLRHDTFQKSRPISLGFTVYQVTPTAPPYSN